MVTKSLVDDSKKSHPLSNILKNNPDLAAPIKEGDAFEAELLYKDSQKAFFDIVGKATGILYGIEMLNAKDILKNIEVGKKCNVTVVVSENEDGYVELSLIRALWQQNWQEIKRVKDSNETVPVKISAANSGGLMSELYGIKAFIPVSQLSTDHYPHVEDGDKNKILEELKKFVGQDFDVKVLDFNPKADKLILSEKEVTGESVKKSLERYEVGDSLEVIVSGIADFGVFVRLVDDPNIEGLVHISEIDHKLIDSPKEVVKVNDVFKAKIIEIKDGRVSLSFKALKPNPWDEAEKYFTADQEIEGVITKFNPFGALVALGHDLQGLIHVSEFENLEKMKEQLEIGKTYTFVISTIKPSEKRIILKLKK
ncbi:MAG TPA: S1 RNA-binding domain-containing protein [Candidatus Paceibacterota bacterium]|nr:S1 RNA-binding domain-containing protein [Candidatus Magasanikbacteria bacterium]HPW34510.1 S1 RNA-binding domain-containing protein [Candidatus Paceibacterota bacterium]